MNWYKLTYKIFSFEKSAIENVVHHYHLMVRKVNRKWLKSLKKHIQYNLRDAACTYTIKKWSKSLKKHVQYNLVDGAPTVLNFLLSEPSSWWTGKGLIRHLGVFWKIWECWQLRKDQILSSFHTAIKLQYVTS